MDAPGYWDPMPEARRVVAAWTGEPNPPSIGEGRWEELNWRNVPGPFYAGETDTCLSGPLAAPANVLGDEDGTEFVFRQPRDPAEVTAVLRAAWDEVLGGYAWDGDTRWTPEGVRAWWSQAARVRAWAAGFSARIAAASSSASAPPASSPPSALSSSGALDASQLPAVRAYEASFDGELPAYLRAYVFFLSEGRAPRPGELLPDL
ncbi:hypothetical protein [Actinacidiphila rubida]|uniref:Uncharacterized protein n=1 Tax=Actinacidiphila rubida TaxID=310780 RepID=A0A1H8MQ19_9ACTN|nr:hypothetical protein [Actinacidiphila rubida]SEO19358.1 hypothetical protein SAMN05216267_1019126 [Actinacidiphila rubida]